MGDSIDLSRRQLLGAAAAMGTLAASGCVVRQPLAGGSGGATGTLPPRGEFVVRNAHVITMDAKLGDFARGDVHVRNGEIVAVGTDLAAPGAEVIDASKMIVLPGLIDTHTHIWNSTLRNLVMEGPDKGYFPVTLALGKQYTPEDTYRGVRLGVSEFLYSGITTVQDWAHNLRSPEHADADVRALMDCGIRGRFAYGTWQGGPAPDQTMNIADLQRMHRDWSKYSNEGLLQLGMASRSVSDSPRGAVGNGAIHKDWDAARALKLPITLHTGGDGVVTYLNKEGLLGPDVQLLNSTHWNDAERLLVKNSGTHISMAPFSEMRYSYRLPQLLEFLKLGMRISMAIDTPPVSGTTDMFVQMRVLMDTQFVRSGSPMSVTARQVLEMATINGAWDLGIEDKIGSLTPGKRADIILVRTTDLNMAPLGDPVTAIVRSAQPHNVDTVVVDGRILKRGGRMTAIDTEKVAGEAAESLAGLKQRANWA